MSNPEYYRELANTKKLSEVFRWFDDRNIHVFEDGDCDPDVAHGVNAQIETSHNAGIHLHVDSTGTQMAISYRAGEVLAIPAEIVTQNIWIA